MIENMLKESGTLYSNDSTISIPIISIFVSIPMYEVKKKEDNKLPLTPAHDEKFDDNRILAYTTVSVDDETINVPICEGEKDEEDEIFRLSKPAENGEIEIEYEKSDYSNRDLFVEDYDPQDMVSTMETRNGEYKKIEKPNFFKKMFDFFRNMYEGYDKDAADGRQEYQGVIKDMEDNVKKSYEAPKDTKPKSLLKKIMEFIKKKTPEEPEEPPEIPTDKVIKFEHLNKDSEEDKNLELRLVA